MDIGLRDELIFENDTVVDEIKSENQQFLNEHVNVTKAVIIAAGNGSRLKGYQNNCPKPLVKVGGMPLLSRVILSAKRIGVTEFVIVIGYQAEKVRTTINASQLGVKITWVTNDDWKKQNGVSVLKAEKYVDSKFLLFMSDHVFDSSILNRIKHYSLNGDSAVLCVDYATDQINDINDATKVHSKNNRLINLGKKLSSFNAIDIGIFVCKPTLFDALHQSQAEGDETLSGGIRVLAREGKMAVFNIGDAFWQDVDTISEIKYAEKLVLKSTQSKNDGVIARTINRRISSRISKWLVKTPITPNQISLFNLLFSLFTAWILSAGKPIYTIIGGLCFQLASIFDGCDGEVAIMKLKDSKAGALFDTVTDSISYFAFIIGVTFGAYHTTQNKLLFIITGVILLFLFYSQKLGLQYIKKENSGSFKALDNAIAGFNHPQQQVWYLKLFGSIHQLGRRDMFAFATFLVMLSGNIVLAYWLMISAITLICIGISVSAASMLSKSGRFQPLRWLQRYLYPLRNLLIGPNLELQPEKKIPGNSSNTDIRN